VLRLFYFSGTGNARNAAHWIAREWREHGRAAEVRNLAGLDARGLRLEVDDELGLASATHGFNFPPTTLGFLFALPRAPARNRAFVVNTRGGVRLFGVFVPGLSGVAQLLAALVLVLKGYRVVGMRPIDLPSSWISLHPGLREENIRAIYERCAEITRRFAGRLLQGGRDLHALRDLPQDLLLAPIALGYYLVGRFLFAKSFIASRDCDACGACVAQCPTRALQLVDGRPYWTWRCESCMRCMNRCPRRAIQTSHAFVAVVLVAASLLNSRLIAPALGSLAPSWPGAALHGRLLHFALDSAITLAVLFLAYAALHRLLRVRPLERVVVGASLTHFECWRRYRPPRGGSARAKAEPSGAAATGPENASDSRGGRDS
jgi:Pyruvate/2-oxoacid:ferredoxin oxidoreductase delta subunit